jgi:hypothetical protein
MLAGMLSDSGYYMGDHLWSVKDEGNPTGYYEDLEINSINEDILATVVPEKPRNLVGKLLFKSRPNYWERWAVAVPANRNISCPDHVVHRIRHQVSHQPFCFKDPRFCYTLPAWLPYLELSSLVYVVIFRDPLITAASMVKEAKRPNPTFDITLKKALKIWECMYGRVLNLYQEHNLRHAWVFFHYEQFFLSSLSACELLEQLLGVPVNANFPDKNLKRSVIPSNSVISRSQKEIYDKLCSLAGFSN